MNRDVGGLVVPIITPLNMQEQVDEKAFRSLLRHVQREGMDCVFSAGSNGEGASLLPRQRDRANEIALDELGDGMPVLCGVLESSTQRTIEGLKRVERMGGQYAVVTSTYYVRHSCDEELITHFRAISESTTLKILVYNIPVFTQIDIGNQVVARLMEMDNIVGVKDSGGNFTAFQKLLNLPRKRDFKVLQGVTELAGASMLLGADGCVPALAPLFPEIFRGLRDAAREGDIQRTVRLQRWANRCNAVMYAGRNAIAAVKYAMSLLGLSEARVTRPCLELTDGERAAIVALYEEILREFAAESGGDCEVCG